MLVTDVRREPATAALIERAEIDDNIRALVLTGFGAREMRSNRSTWTCTAWQERDGDGWVAELDLVRGRMGP